MEDLMKYVTYANPDVLEFYKELPFNYRESPENDVQAIRSTNTILSYPVLPPLLRPGIRVLDVGCGAGWLSNGVAYHYGATVLGIDFNPVAIQRATTVAESLGVGTRFQVADLFTFRPEEPFDVVVSIGVLHHTDNCLEGVRRCFDVFVKPEGHVFIGLYHRYGRAPFLEHFTDMKARGASEEEMLARYAQLHSQLAGDKTHLESWFRDQCLHPHETQHTLKEIAALIEDSDMELVATSINRFEPFVSLDSLFEEEKFYEDVGRERLTQNQYFPGFFVFLARKTGTART